MVIGASGFTGSHVTRLLVARGEDVRVMIRTTSSTCAIYDLDVERVYGDIFNDEALREAMAGCDVVYYCVVDARSWLQDPAPLFRTNVDGLRHVLDAAVAADLDRFVFLSTIGTLAIRDDAAVTELRMTGSTGPSWVAATSPPASRPRTSCCSTSSTVVCRPSRCACR